MSESDNPILMAALAYASRGWPVFPLQPAGKIPFAGTHGFQDATVDESTIRAWWTRWPKANVGLPTGQRSGVFVVDIDPKNGGDLSLDGLVSRHGSASETVRCNTHSGGVHYYFKHRPGLRNSAGAIAKGIDTRGDGGYVVLPPSIGPTGALYEWAEHGDPEESNVIDLPDWLTPGALASPQLAAGNLGLTVKPTAADGSPVAEGSRNMAAASLAGRYIQQGQSLHEVRRLLEGWNQTNPKPLPAKEIDTVVASVARTHAHKNPAKPVPVIDPEPEALAAPATLDIRPKFPPHLLTPPGLVGEIASYINATAIKPQPVFALANALAFMGAVVGRKVATPTDLRTNLYVLGVGDSGCGKDHSRKVIKRICDAAGLTESILGGEEVSSDSAVLAAVHENPSVLFLWDEIGHMIGSITSRYSASHVKAIAPTLTKLFSSANTKMLGKQYARGENARKDVDQPNVCLYGTTVPEKLYGGLTPDEIRDGFLGRLLVFVSDDSDPDERMIEPKSVPASIVNMVQAWFNRVDLPRAAGNIKAATTNVPIVVRFEPEAAAVFEDFRRRCRGYKQTAKDGSGGDALWSRALEHASKVSLTVACGVEYAHPVISAEVASWAVAVVEHVTRSLVDAVSSSVSGSEYGRDALRVYRVIARAGAEGCNPSHIMRATQSLHPKMRETILNDLVAQKRVGMKVGENTRGPKTQVYYAIHPTQ